jgi:hypothetical protein
MSFFCYHTENESRDTTTQTTKTPETERTLIQKEKKREPENKPSDNYSLNAPKEGLKTAQ